MIRQFDSEGYSLLCGIFSPAECRNLASGLDCSLAECPGDKTVLRRANGVIYGARNLLAVFPPARTLWRTPRLIALLTDVLGERCGLVRGLYFDKPPDATWSLPWHQ